MKWSSLHDFSFKDLISLVLIFVFTGSIITCAIYYMATKDLTLLEVVKVQIAIIIALISIYGGTEAGELIAGKKNLKNFNPANDESNNAITRNFENKDYNGSI